MESMPSLKLVSAEEMTKLFRKEAAIVLVMPVIKVLAGWLRKIEEEIIRDQRKDSKVGINRI